MHCNLFRKAKSFKKVIEACDHIKLNYLVLIMMSRSIIIIYTEKEVYIHAFTIEILILMEATQCPFYIYIYMQNKQ